MNRVTTPWEVSVAGGDFVTIGHPLFTIDLLMTQSITVRLFAQLRELSGIDVLDYEIPVKGVALSDILAGLHGRPGLAATLGGVRLMTAVNQTMVRENHRVMPGDEVALFPPVTGG